MKVVPLSISIGSRGWGVRREASADHMAGADHGEQPVHQTMCVGLIAAVRAAVLTDHCPEHARTEHPLVQFQPAFAERIFKTLLRPCSETVERDRKACNAHLRHRELPSIWPFI